jgi:hypothetical protein
MTHRMGGKRSRWFASRAGFLVVMAVLLLVPGGVAEGAAAPATQPTSTPDAPGIVVATAPFDLPDPFLLDAKGKYYLFVSTAFGNTKLKVPVLTGTPGHWSKAKDALSSLPSWATPNSSKGTEWAPTVHKFGATYVMYYSPTVRGALPVQHCIGIATSQSPAGPFQPQTNPFICNRTEGGDIDAEVFVDPAGVNGPSHPNYLIWKSDNNSTPGDGTPGIWAQPLSNNGLKLTGQRVRIYQANLPWQHNLIESPQMVRSPDGGIWLFYSASGFYSPDYAMGVATCIGPLGPCSDVSSTPLVASNSQGPGPGEETAFTAADGSTWLIYNPWAASLFFTNSFYRPAQGIRIGWNGTGPYVAEAGTFPSPG